jgi:hypothetical protein
MSRLLGVCFGVAAAFLLCIGSSLAQADGNDLKDGLERLFETGWNRSVNARAEARQQYEKLLSQFPKDVRVPFAYALVQLRQLRYPDAAKLIDRVLQTDPKNLAARKAKVWLAMLTKEYDAALSEMPRLADLLPADDAPGDAETPFREIAGLLGRLIGFLEGPAKDSVDGARLADCRQRIVSKLSSTRQTVFDQARRSVVEQYAGAAEEADQTGAAAQDAATRRKEKMLQDLDRKAEDTAAQAAAEEKRLEELKKKFDYELEKIAAEERSVLEQGRQIEVQAVGYRRELQVLDERIAQLLSLADQTDDPNEKQRLYNDATILRARRQRPLAVLADLDRRYATLNAQRAGLVQRRQEIQVRYQQESGRADQLRGSLDRIRKDKGRVQNQSVSGNTPQVRDQKKRSVSLTTYVPLPLSLDAERDRLLESFP